MKINIIDSQKFVQISNVIFSEITTYDDFISKNKDNNLSILQKRVFKDETFINYISNNYSLRENDIIYCQSNHVEELFRSLKNINQFKNIKLITHQSDRAITKELFSLKPQCISTWYAVNVAYKNTHLIPIPLGVNINYTNNYPVESDFKDFKFKKFEEKDQKIYVNFNVNTKPFHRFNAELSLKSKKNVIFETNDLDKKEYLSTINNYKYILSPFGNGYDTHRVWEAIYSNSIPIVENHISFSSFKDLPIIYVDKISKANLILNSINKRNSNLEKADFNYWKDLINNNKVENNNTEMITIDRENQHKNFLKLRRKNIIRNQRYKKIRYFIFRVYKKLAYLLSI